MCVLEADSLNTARVLESGGRGEGVNLVLLLAWRGGSLPGERRGLGQGVEAGLLRRSRCLS